MASKACGAMSATIPAATGRASKLEELMWRRGVEHAWTALAEMHRGGETTDRRTISRMLKRTVASCRARPQRGLIFQALELIESFMHRRPQDIDEVLFNEVLDACCVLGDMRRFDAARRQMRALGVTPSAVTLGILVKAYGKNGRMDKVLQAWDEMEEQRAETNVVTYSCMVEACVKCKHLDKAVQIFEEMRRQGAHRNTVLYCTLIKGYGLVKDFAKAMELFREMAAEGVDCNTVTYNAMLDVCVKCGEVEKAEDLMCEMTSPRSAAKPDMISFSTLMKGYCHNGDIERAFQVVDAMKARGLHCDELVYNTLIDACTKARDISAAVGLFEEMLSSGIKPSSTTYRLLEGLYQSAEDCGMAQDAVEDLCRQHGVEPPRAGAASSMDQRGAAAKSAWPDHRGRPSHAQQPAVPPPQGKAAGWGPATGGRACPCSPAPMAPAGAARQLGGVFVAASVALSPQQFSGQANCGGWPVQGDMGFALQALQQLSRGGPPPPGQQPVLLLSMAIPCPSAPADPRCAAPLPLSLPQQAVGGVDAAQRGPQGTWCLVPGCAPWVR